MSYTHSVEGSNPSSPTMKPKEISIVAEEATRELLHNKTQVTPEGILEALSNFFAIKFPKGLPDDDFKNDFILASLGRATDTYSRDRATVTRANKIWEILVDLASPKTKYK